MLADYQMEQARLIRELRRQRTLPSEAEEPTSPDRATAGSAGMSISNARNGRN